MTRDELKSLYDAKVAAEMKCNALYPSKDCSFEDNLTYQNAWAEMHEATEVYMDGFTKFRKQEGAI